MLVVLNNEIFNMEKSDTVRPMDREGNYPDRISFFRNSEEYEYASFDSKQARDEKWEQIKTAVNTWYS